MHGFGSDITINVLASIIASGILLGAGFLWGKYKERRFDPRLEEYDFYSTTTARLRRKTGRSRDRSAGKT